jgi:hypothetical protein
MFMVIFYNKYIAIHILINIMQKDNLNLLDKKEGKTINMSKKYLVKKKGMNKTRV